MVWAASKAINIALNVASTVGVSVSNCASTRGLSFQDGVQNRDVLIFWYLSQVRTSNEHPLLEVISESEHRGWGNCDWAV